MKIKTPPLTPTELRYRTSTIKLVRGDEFDVRACKGEMKADIYDTIGCPHVHFDIDATIPSIPDLFRRMLAPGNTEAIVVSAPAEVPFVVVSMQQWRQMVRNSIELDRKERIERREAAKATAEARLAEMQRELEEKKQ